MLAYQQLLPHFPRTVGPLLRCNRLIFVGFGTGEQAELVNSDHRGPGYCILSVKGNKPHGLDP